MAHPVWRPSHAGAPHRTCAGTSTLSAAPQTRAAQLAPTALVTGSHSRPQPPASCAKQGGGKTGGAKGGCKEHADRRGRSHVQGSAPALSHLRVVPSRWGARQGGHGCTGHADSCKWGLLDRGWPRTCAGPPPSSQCTMGTPISFLEVPP